MLLVHKMNHNWYGIRETLNFYHLSISLQNENDVFDTLPAVDGGRIWTRKNQQ